MKKVLTNKQKCVKLDYGPEEKRVISKEQFVRGFLKFCEMAEHTPSTEELEKVKNIYDRRDDYND